MLTPEQIVLLRDKLGLWRHQAETGSDDWRDYNRRCADALQAALDSAARATRNKYFALRDRAAVLANVREEIRDEVAYALELAPNTAAPANTGDVSEAPAQGDPA